MIHRRAILSGRPRTRLTHRRGRRGFTLVELLVVIGIIAMILGMSIPVFAVIKMQRSLRGGVDILQGMIIKLREKAASSGQPAFLVVEHWETPPRLTSWRVEADKNSPPNYTFFKTASVDLPDGVFFQTDTWKYWINGVSGYVKPSPTIDFAPLLEALCTKTGPDTPEYDFANLSKLHGGRAYVLIFKPSGALEIFGAKNAAPWSIESDNPVSSPPWGDLILTNQNETIFIDLNPANGRTRWREYDDLIGN